MVGSPIESEIMGLSGLGTRFIVSRMFRIGLNVFRDIFEAEVFQDFCWNVISDSSLEGNIVVFCFLSLKI